VRRTNFTTSPFYSDHISDIELTWIKLNITVMAPTNVAAAQWRDIWERDRGGDNVMTALLILSAAAAAATTTKSTMMRLPRGPSASHMVVCDMAYEQRASTNCGVRWTLMSHFSKLGVGQNYAFLYFFLFNRSTYHNMENFMLVSTKFNFGWGSDRACWSSRCSYLEGFRYRR